MFAQLETYYEMAQNDDGMEIQGIGDGLELGATRSSSKSDQRTSGFSNGTSLGTTERKSRLGLVPNKGRDSSDKSERKSVNHSLSLPKLGVFSYPVISSYSDYLEKRHEILDEIQGLEFAQNDATLPVEFKLHQNYPNPFNPATTIRFDLPDASHVSLRVFNILGQEVMEVLNMDLVAGYHRSIVDMSSLSSGVYIYQIKTDQRNDLKKMILIK